MEPLKQDEPARSGEGSQRRSRRIWWSRGPPSPRTRRCLPVVEGQQHLPLSLAAVAGNAPHATGYQHIHGSFLGSAMPTGRLTVARANRLTAPGRYADGGCLYLVVTPTGARQWVARLTIHGRQTDLGLGGAVLRHPGRGARGGGAAPQGRAPGRRPRVERRREVSDLRGGGPARARGPRAHLAQREARARVAVVTRALRLPPPRRPPPRHHRHRRRAGGARADLDEAAGDGPAREAAPRRDLRLGEERGALPAARTR